jgi:hypothetical protein
LYWLLVDARQIDLIFVNNCERIAPTDAFY